MYMNYLLDNLFK